MQQNSRCETLAHGHVKLEERFKVHLATWQRGSATAESHLVSASTMRAKILIMLRFWMRRRARDASRPSTRPLNRPLDDCNSSNNQERSRYQGHRHNDIPSVLSDPGLLQLADAFSAGVGSAFGTYLASNSKRN